MKRIGYIYEKIIDKDNLRNAILQASNGKQGRKRVQNIVDNIDYYVEKLYEILKNEQFENSTYTIKTIYDRSSRKERTICVPKFFPDQCVHWALMLQLSPIFLSKFYTYSCASIKNRGGTYAQKYIDRIKKNDRKGTKYFLKLDVKKFYPSLKKEIVLDKLNCIIKDKKCLRLCDKILSITDGLPIGFYTSQWFGNFVLTYVDNFILSQKCVCHYVRYLDDMIVFGSNRRALNKLCIKIDEYLNGLQLTLKKQAKAIPFDVCGLDFVGIRFFRNYDILRKRMFYKIRRVCIRNKNLKSLLSYKGWIFRTNINKFKIEIFNNKYNIARSSL